MFLMSISCLILITGLLGMIWVKNSIHMIWWMVMSYIGGAGIVSERGGMMLPWVILLIYIGAIVILFLFALFMLEEIRSGKSNINYVIIWLSIVIILFNENNLIKRNSESNEISSLFNLYDQMIIPFIILLIFLFLALFAVVFVRLS